MTVAPRDPPSLPTIQELARRTLYPLIDYDGLNEKCFAEGIAVEITQKWICSQREKSREKDESPLFQASSYISAYDTHCKFYEEALSILARDEPVLMNLVNDMETAARKLRTWVRKAKRQRRAGRNT